MLVFFCLRIFESGSKIRLALNSFQLRYIEYVYLVLAGMSLVFLATEFDSLSQRTVILMCISMGIFAFMFAFRRAQRISMEKRMEEEMDEIWEDLGREEEEDEATRQSKQ